jgi:hypothetical protein
MAKDSIDEPIEQEESRQEYRELYGIEAHIDSVFECKVRKRASSCN